MIPWFSVWEAKVSGFVQRMEGRVLGSTRVRRRLSGVLGFIGRLLIFTGFSFIILYPMLYMLSVGFRQADDMADPMVIWIPKHLTLENIQDAFRLMDYPTSLRNSVTLGVVSSLLQILSCALVGYGFARFEFRFKKLLFAMVILTLIIPPQLTILSSFLQFQFFDIFGIIRAINGRGINLIGGVTPLVILACTCMGLKNGLFIYLFRQIFKGMPRETEEAAYVDGASTFRIFYSVMLPGAISAIVTVLLFSFVWQYNDLLITSTYVKNFKLLPMMYSSHGAVDYTAVGIGGASLSDFDWQYTAMIRSTGVLLMILPVVILYIIAQRYFVEGIERSGLVG